MKFVKENNRTIPKEDKVFALSGRAKAAAAQHGKENVLNATVGALLDDNGDLVILSSVVDAIKTLEPADFAEYAPITGLPAFKDAVGKALFGDYVPKGDLEICATPGGTGSIKSVIDNYSNVGDTILTHDWCWANYKNIAAQHGRNMATFAFFNDDGSFNGGDLKRAIDELAETQDQIVLMLNTPAHNPTGYSLTLKDWENLVRILNDAPCKVALFLDVAYIDYAGEDDEVRAFMPCLEKLTENTIVIFGYSASKTLTAYGMRLGAIVCLSENHEILDEFKRASEYVARSTWSNCNKSAQVLMAKIYGDPALLKKVSDERRIYRDMLLERGRAFESTLLDEGIKPVPFDAGFFVTVGCDNPDEICQKLEEQNIFCLALPKGIRVSVASMSKEKCIKCAKAIAELLKK